MRIISQDGKCDYPYENSTLFIDYMDGRVIKIVVGIKAEFFSGQLFRFTGKQIAPEETAHEVDSRAHGSDRFLFADKMRDACPDHAGISIIVQ